ncbi:unnamed protein product, partial [Rotaria sp. Silwood2]
TSKTYETPPISDKTVQKKHVQEASRKQGVVPAYQVLRDIQYITRDTENGQSEETLSSYEDDDDFETDDDDDSTERIIGITNSLTTAARLKSTSVNKVKSQQSKQSSSYAFKTTSHETTSKRLCNKQLFPSNSDGYQEIMVLLKSSILTNKDLARDMKLSLLDIKQLFVLIEKLDAKLNLIFDNQKKIQRALAKRKINVALFGGDFDAENQSQSDVPFERSLNYQKQDGTTIDLLQLYGVRTQIGRFVALVMDHVFTKHELCTITTNQLIKDERYNTIKEAVRSRFKLNAEEMNAEWPTIHESILQKRRNENIAEPKSRCPYRKNHIRCGSYNSNNIVMLQSIENLVSPDALPIQETSTESDVAHMLSLMLQVQVEQEQDSVHVLPQCDQFPDSDSQTIINDFVK